LEILKQLDEKLAVKQGLARSPGRYEQGLAERVEAQEHDIRALNEKVQSLLPKPSPRKLDQLTIDNDLQSMITSLQARATLMETSPRTVQKLVSPKSDSPVDLSRRVWELE
jgi:hypothetical protein